MGPALNPATRGAIACLAALACLVALAACGDSSPPKPLNSSGTYSAATDSILAVSGDGKIAVAGPDRISVFDSRLTDRPTHSIPAQGVTDAVAVGTRLYVIEHPAGLGDTALAAFDVDRGTRVGDVELGAAAGKPENLAASADGRTLLVLGSRDASSVLSVLDARTGAVRSSTPLSGVSPGLALASSDGTHAYLSSTSQPSQLLTVDTATGKIVNRTTIPGAVFDIAVSPDRKSLYVGSCPRGGSVSVVAAASATVRRTIELPGKLCPAGLAAGHAAGRLYVAMAGRGGTADSMPGTVLALDPTKGEVIGQVGAGVYPVQVVAARDGKRVFVVDGSGTVHVYTTG